MTTREEIARIINPGPFTALEREVVPVAPEEKMDMDIALAKADAILAALSPPEPTGGPIRKHLTHTMLTHLRHMARVRPAGLDRDAAEWAIGELERRDKLGHQAFRLAVQHQERADAAEAALRTSGAGWQPIETAPRDETAIQLGRHGYTPLTGYSGPGRTQWWMPGTGAHVPFRPTHWRHLSNGPPAIPAETEGK